MNNWVGPDKTVSAMDRNVVTGIAQVKNNWRAKPRGKENGRRGLI